MAPILRIKGGEQAGKTISVGRELVVGRAPTCDLTVADQRLSRRHARFFVEDDALYVEDLGSPNGTFVNRTRVPRARLEPGDLVLLGKTELVVIDQSEEPPTIPPGADQPPMLVKHVQDAKTPGLGFMRPSEFLAAVGLAEATELEPLRDVQELMLRRARHFAILHGIGEVIQREQDPQEMLARVLDLALDVTGADRGFVALIRPDGTPRLAIARGAGTERAEPQISRTVWEHVIGRRAAVICADPTSDERFQNAASLMLSQTRSLMAAPILAQSRPLGLFQLESGHLRRRFEEPDLDLLSMIASMAGVAVENLELAREREATIRELEEANERLLGAQERLIRSEQLAAIGRLATGIAHEVKNHLGPFALASEIARKYPDDEKTLEVVEMMREAQQHILDLVREIGTFARGDQTVLERHPQDVADTVARVLDFLACDRAVSRADIAVEVEDRPIVELDPRSFRQVLLNLVRNAVDALPEQGGRVLIRVRENDGHALIDVADNGHGIPDDVAPHLFEPFFSTKGERGLGLGLDISRKLVQAHGGTLTFATELGRGSTFRITLPLAGGDRPPRADEAGSS